MSEDQIRRELLAYREENQESHKAILDVIHSIKCETVEAVGKENKILIDANDKILKSYKTIVRLAAGVMIGFFGWLALDHLSTKASLSDLKTDFGYILLLAPKDHSETIMFDEIKNKYNPKRGTDKRDTTKYSINNFGVLKNDEEDIKL